MNKTFRRQQHVEPYYVMFERWMILVLGVAAVRMALGFNRLSATVRLIRESF
jgi:hypothetical protein